MKKINKQAWIVLLGFAMIGIILDLCTKPKDHESLKQVMGTALKEQIVRDTSLLGAIVSMAEVGKPVADPVSVFVAEKGDVIDYYADRLPVVPGSIMAPVTQTFRRECVIDTLSINWKLADYFGESKSDYIPKSYYKGVIRPVHAGIVDGSGIILTQKQILTFYNSLANGGVRPRYRYFKKRRICKEQTALEMMELLKGKDHDGDIAGIAGSGELSFGRLSYMGNVDDIGPVTVSSFVGFFPAEAPKYTMCVTVYSTDKTEETSGAYEVFRSIVKKMNNQGVMQKEDPTVAWLRKHFPGKLIITTQEQVDSLLEEATKRIGRDSSAEAYYFRASYFQLKGTPDSYRNSLQDLDTALAILPANDTSNLRIGMLFMRAKCYEGLKRTDLAEQTYKEILRDYPDDEEARLTLANFYQSLGRDEEAWEVYPDSSFFQESIFTEMQRNLREYNSPNKPLVAL